MQWHFYVQLTCIFEIGVLSILVFIVFFHFVNYNLMVFREGGGGPIRFHILSRIAWLISFRNNNGHAYYGIFSTRVKKF